MSPFLQACVGINGLKLPTGYPYKRYYKEMFRHQYNGRVTVPCQPVATEQQVVPAVEQKVQLTLGSPVHSQVKKQTGKDDQWIDDPVDNCGNDSGSNSNNLNGGSEITFAAEVGPSATTISTTPYVGSIIGFNPIPTVYPAIPLSGSPYMKGTYITVGTPEPIGPLIAGAASFVVPKSGVIKNLAVTVSASFVEFTVPVTLTAPLTYQVYVFRSASSSIHGGTAHPVNNYYLLQQLSTTVNFEGVIQSTVYAGTHFNNHSVAVAPGDMIGVFVTQTSAARSTSGNPTADHVAVSASLNYVPY